MEGWSDKGCVELQIQICMSTLHLSSPYLSLIILFTNWFAYVTLITI